MKAEYIQVIILSVVIFFLLVYSFVYSLTYPELFGIIKAITMLQYTGFLLFAIVVTKLVEDYKEWFIENKNILLVVATFVLMAFLYEYIWTMFYWFSNYGFYGIKTDIDNITFVPMEGRISYPYNMNVNSKWMWFGTFCAIFLLIKIITLKERGFVV